MSSKLSRQFLEKLAIGLKRSSIKKPSEWATQYRVMAGDFPGPWAWKHHPWLKEMHDAEGELTVGQKAAQLGYTELLLNLVFYHIDILGHNCLYVLPSKTPDATDFSSSRFDAALDLSKHLSLLFSDVKNVGHKRAGSANLYIRGSQSKAGLRSLDINFLVFDEVDVMKQSNIPLAMERTSGKLQKIAWMVSTPTHEDLGINRYYKLSTQEHFFFKCPCCSRKTELLYPESLEICGDSIFDPRIKETYLKCMLCKGKLPHETKKDWLSINSWEPSNAAAESRGFYINQLYSPTIEPRKIAESYFMAQSNPADEQELYNSKLGLPHTTEGARLTFAELLACKRGHKNSTYTPNKLVTMGIDVGKVLHIEIDEWSVIKNAHELDMILNAKPKVIYIGTQPNFEDLVKLMAEFRVMYAVIDANPEKRQALTFVNRYYGRARMCYYVRGVIGKTVNFGKDPNEPTVQVDRTSWLDQSLGRFRTGLIELPYDTPQEYMDHMVALIKHFQKDRNGDVVGRYITGEHVPDHYAHARNYAEIAFKMLVSRDQVTEAGQIL